MSLDTVDATTARPGTEKLLETPKLALDRLPLLTSILERLVAYCAESFRDLCLIPASFFVNQLEAGNSWDVLETYEDSIAGIYYARQWDANVIIGLDRRFIYSLTDAAFGGDGSNPPFESDRPFTSLEARLSKTVFEIVVPAFEELLHPITPVSFELEKIESKLDFQIMGQTEIPVVVVQILFQILDNGGRLFMIIPQQALHPVRKRLERARAFDIGGNDPDWTSKLQNEIVTADVKLQSVLEAPELSLDDLASLQPGQIIRLACDAQTPVALECEGEKIFWCKLAQSKGYFSMVIDTPIDKEQEFLSGLLPTKKTR
jgi:flagellar motor switch protein FliM